MAVHKNMPYTMYTLPYNWQSANVPLFGCIEHNIMAVSHGGAMGRAVDGVLSAVEIEKRNSEKDLVLKVSRAEPICAMQMRHKTQKIQTLMGFIKTLETCKWLAMWRLDLKFPMRMWHLAWDLYLPQNTLKTALFLHYIFVTLPVWKSSHNTLNTLQRHVSSLQSIQVIFYV